MTLQANSPVFVDSVTPVARCLGYGSFIALRHTGPLGTLFFASIGLDWNQILLVQMLQIISSGIFGMGLWSLRNLGVVLPHRSTSRCCVAALGICFILCYIAARLGFGVWIIYVLSFLMGAFAVYLMLQWLDVLVQLCRSHGRVRCTASISGCYFVAMVLTLPLAFVQASGIAILEAVLIVCVISLASQEVLVWSGAYQGLIKPSDTNTYVSNSPSAPATKARRYSLTPYAISLLLSFGTLYGIVDGIILLSRQSGQGFPTWMGLAATMLVCLFSMQYHLMRSNALDVHFGQCVRLSVVSTGIVLAAAPALGNAIPNTMGLLYGIVSVIQGIAMALFSIEICGETQTDTLSITPLNYGVWTAAAGAGMAAVWAFASSFDERAALDCIVFLAMIASLAVVPMLPSRSSNASTFTLAQLPENEDSSSRAARSRDAFAARLDLTTREAEVFNLLVTGKTRREIAEQLLLSSWTVKGYVANIYEKAGVHSAKELMALVNKGD